MVSCLTKYPWTRGAEYDRVMAKESLMGGWWYKVSCLNEVYIFITMAFMLIKCIHHYQAMQQQLLFVSDAKLEKSTTAGGEKDGAASSTDAGGAKKDENVHTIERETEGSDKTTINIESRVSSGSSC
jgi:hypothetical protein